MQGDERRVGLYLLERVGHCLGHKFLAVLVGLGNPRAWGGREIVSDDLDLWKHSRKNAQNLET